MLFTPKVTGLGSLDPISAFNDAIYSIGVSVDSTDNALTDSLNKMLGPLQGSGSTAIANAYQTMKYGNIPVPGSGITAPPNPAAPSAGNLLSWTPDQVYSQAPADFSSWAKQIGTDITNAQNSGSYSPSGQGLNWWVVGGLGVLALFILSGGKGI